MGLLDSLNPFSAVTDLIGTVLKRVLPNKEAAQQQEHDRAMGQQFTNTAEAQTSGGGGLIGILKSWRGFVGWACGMAIVWQFVVRPLLAGAFPGSRFPGYAPEDIALLGRILLGMLGLGG